jgi:hypothetical protein
MNMMDATIWMDGTIVGRRSGVFKAPDSGKEDPYAVVQMTAKDKEAMKVFEINLASGADLSRYPIGSKAKIAVRVGASKDGKRIYYREVEPEQEPDPAKSTRPRTDEPLRPAAKL